MLRICHKDAVAPQRQRIAGRRRLDRASVRAWAVAVVIAAVGGAPSILPFAKGVCAHAAEPLPDSLPEDAFSVRVDPGEHTAAVTSIATTPGGEYVVTASVDRTARVWDGKTGELVRTLRPPSQAAGPEGRLFAVAISPDGALIATAGVTRFFENAEERSSAVYLFERKSGAMLRVLAGARSSTPEELVTRIAFSPDGQRLVAVHSKAATAVFAVATGQTLAANLEPIREVLDADFDASGRLLLTTRGGLLRLFDRELRPGTQIQISDRQPLMARFSADGLQVAVLYEKGPRLELRAAKDLQRRRDVPNSTLGDESQLRGLAFSTDGKSLYATGRGQSDGPGLLWRWSLKNNAAERAELAVAQGLPLALAPRPGGGVLFAADDPKWGAVDAANQIVYAVGDRHPLVALPDALRVDASGDRVELPLTLRGQESVRFQVSELRLLRAPPADPALRPPRSQLAGHEVTGWRSEGRVRFDGVVLTLPPEYGAAMAVAPGGRSFVLGTSYRLTRYLVDNRERDREGCPLPAGEGLAPPCARIAVEGALAVNWSGDGRYLVALLRDGSVRWYAAAGLSEQLALYLHRDGKRWALWRPDGTFAASVGGDELVGYHQNRPRGQSAEFFPLARLRPSRERPSALAAALRTPSGPSATATAAPASVPAAALRQVLPPTLTVTAPADGAAVDTGQVVVHVKIAVPEGQELTALRVLVDGRLAVKLSGEGGAERDLTVPVPPRDCTVAVIAQSAAGSSPPAQLRLRWTGPAPAAAGPQLQARLLLLAIGVGAYNRSELRLTYPAKDARDLAELLKSQRAGLYREVQARVLTDAQATRQGILAGIEWLHHTAAPEDTLVLLLAGHGISDAATGQYYFLPADADPQNPLATMLPASALQQALATLPGRVVLLLDTCHAGDVLPGRKLRGVPAGPDDGISRFVSELGSIEQGVVVLTASVGTQSSQESPEWGNGVFTKALLEGLRGQADYRKTGRVTVNMLDLYISERVRELTRGTQTPATAKPSTIADFPLVLSP